MNPLSISCTGLSVGEELIFRSLIRLAWSATRHRWTFTSDVSQCAAIVVGPMSAPLARTASIALGRVVISTEQLAHRTSLDEHKLQLPFRFGQITSLLNEMAKNLDDAWSPPPIDVPRGTLLEDAVDALARLQGRTEMIATRLLIAPNTQVSFVERDGRQFWASEENLAEVIARLHEGAHASVRADSQVHKTALPVRGTVKELLWAMAATVNNPRLRQTDSQDWRYKLTSWPPVDARISSSREIHVVAALLRAPVRHSFLVSLVEGDELCVDRVLYAADRCGLLKSVSSPVIGSADDDVVQTHVSPPRAGLPTTPVTNSLPVQKRPGLLKMIRLAIGV